MILIPLIAAITFLRNSRRGRTHSTARFHTTTKRRRAIGPRRRALFHGSIRRIRGRLFRLVKVAGLRSAKVIERLTRNGKTLDLSVPITGNERPKPNLNKGAGLDVSPAVRDYLGVKETDVTDWRFVDFSEVPRGPWSTVGENNTFVINDRKKGEELAEAPRRSGSVIAR